MQHICQMPVSPFLPLKELSMNMSLDQVVSSTKANAAEFFSLSSLAIESLDKYVQLNVAATRSSMRNAAKYFDETFGIKDLKKFSESQVSQLQPSMEKSAAYARLIYEINSDLNKAIKDFAEKKRVELQKSASETLDAAFSQTPQGSESLMAIVKSAFNFSSSSIESIHKAMDHLMGTFDASISKATNAALDAAKVPSGPTKKSASA